MKVAYSVAVVASTCFFAFTFAAALAYSIDIPPETVVTPCCALFLLLFLLLLFFLFVLLLLLLCCENVAALVKVADIHWCWGSSLLVFPKLFLYIPKGFGVLTIVVLVCFSDVL